MNQEAVKRFTEKATNDQVFLTRVCEAESVTELMQISASCGIDIDEEVADLIWQGFARGKNEEDTNDTELSELELEQVSGGYVLTGTGVIVIGASLYLLYRGGKVIGKYGVKAMNAIRDWLCKIF